MQTLESLGNELKLNISLRDNETSNELLNFLSSNAEVNHFMEVIPSANDIFIQTINNQK
jgi:ABC-2 type transport system ATP-binding protein